MWKSVLSSFTLLLCLINYSHLQEVFDQTTNVQYEYPTDVPSRIKYECDTSDETTNLQIFISVCKCLTLKNSEISLHKQMQNETTRWEVENCLKMVEETEEKLAAQYDLKSSAKIYAPEAELVVREFNRTDADTLQNLLCQKATAENTISELELPAKIVCEAFRFLRSVVPVVAAEIRAQTCWSDAKVVQPTQQPLGGRERRHL